jgi:hypothetical protein
MDKEEKIKEEKDLDSKSINPQEEKIKEEDKTQLKPGQKVVKKDGKDVVVYENIEASKLDAIMEKLDRLEYAADKGRLENFDSKKRGINVSEVGIKINNGKYVIGWRAKEDTREELIGKNAWIIRQISEIIYQDGKTEEIPTERLVKLKMAKGQVIKKEDIEEIVDDEKVITKLFTVKIGDDEVKIQDIFVN